MGRYYSETNPIRVNTITTIPFGAIGFITWLVFLILKLTQNPEWLTWFWVWFPFWLPLAFFGAGFIVILIFVLIAALIEHYYE